MADQTIEIRLVLRDELSRQLAPVVAQLNQLANTRVDNAHRGFERFGGAVRVVHRELSTLSRLTLGGIVGGGVVAGIVAATKAVGDMARQNVQLRYSAQSLGVSTKFIEDSTDALVGLGEAPEQAANAIKQSLGTLDEFFVKGNKSSLGQFLEKSLGGPQVAAQLRQVIAREGEEAGLMFMINYGKGIKDRRGQAEFFKQLNLPFSAQDMAKILPQLGPRVQLTAKQMDALVLANAQYERSARNIGLILGNALTPAITKVMEALDKYLQSESGQKFAARIKEIATAVSEALKKWIEEGGLEKALTTLENAFAQADAVIKAMGLTWPQVIGALVVLRFAPWLLNVAAALASVSRFRWMFPWLATLVAGSAALQYLHENFNKDQQHDQQPNRPGYDTEDVRRRVYGEAPVTLWERLRMRGRRFRRYMGNEGPQKQSYQDDGGGLAKSDAERRADLEQEKSERNALTEELGVLAYSVGKLNAFLPVGGPEGTAGLSGFQFSSSGGDTPLFDRSSASQMRLAPRGSGAFSRWLETQKPSINFEDRTNEWAPGLSPDQMTRFSRQASIERGGVELGGERHSSGYPYIQSPQDYAYGLKTLRTGHNVPPSFGVNWNKSFEDNPTLRALQAERNDRDSKTEWGGPAGLLTSSSGGGSMNLFGGDSIVNAIARDGGGGSITGSATVDIDVGGLGQPARNPAGMFKPQTLTGTEQLSGVPRTQANPLSLQ
jgi:hypothetical protein